MKKQVIDVDGYWKVIVWYNIDYDLFKYIINDLKDIYVPNKEIKDIYQTMSLGKAKAFTCSSLHDRTSVIGFNRHPIKTDYINSIVHEAEHVKQAMLKAYRVDDSGEPPAYTVGYLVMKMYEFICNYQAHPNTRQAL